MSESNSGTIRYDVQNEAMALHIPKIPLDETPRPVAQVQPEAEPEGKLEAKLEAKPAEEEAAEVAVTPLDVVTVAAE
jgi:hypothetical protein